MRQEKKFKIYFYDLNELIGYLYVSFANGKEIHSFEFVDSFLLSNIKNRFYDPDLLFISGRQYPSSNRVTFSFLEDSLPDRWGRKLILRYNLKNKNKELSTIDFLISVSDIYRLGAIRIADENDNFLSNNNTRIPPWMYLNRLEQAAIEVEDEKLDVDINLLLSPGSSLGGARPKCNVFDNDKEVYIAKFPNKKDDIDVGLAEMVVHDLAKLCEINVPEAKIELLSKYGTTYLTKRFDRSKEQRIHFTSALCLLNADQGDDDHSYLEFVDLIKEKSADPEADLLELFKRIVFNVVVNNTDDHLRNHGFIYRDSGWELSPAFDINVNIYDHTHVLAIDSYNHQGNLNSLRTIAKYFRLSGDKAESIINKTVDIVKNQFETIAHQYKMKQVEIELIKKQFVLD